MGKGVYRRKSSGSRSRRYRRPEEDKARLAALLLLLVLPIVLLLPERIGDLNHPEDWEQASVIYERHVYRTGKGTSWYNLVDSSGQVWRMPTNVDMDRFEGEVQPGRSLHIRFTTWTGGRQIRSMEGFLDQQTAADLARDQAREETGLFVCALAVCLALAVFILFQLNKVHRFFRK